MRIALLGPALPRVLLGDDDETVPVGMGGTAVNQLARGLVEAGHEVHVITTCPSMHAPWHRTAGALTVDVAPYRPRARDRALDMFRCERKAMTALLATSPADVVSAHWTYEFALAALADARPSVVTIRDAPLTILRYQPDPYRAIRTVMAQLVARTTKAFTAPSPYVARAFRRQMLVSTNITIIPNAAPTDMPVLARLETRDPTLLTVGNEAPWENLATLVRAFAEVRRRIPAVRLRVVGRGLGPNDAFPSGLSHHQRDGIAFLGVRSRLELAEELASAWVLVHPSLEESFGNVPLEAMRAGLPVVAGRRSGAVPWVLGQGCADSLVDVSSPAAVAEAVVGLLENGHDRNSLREAGFVRSRQFGLEDVVNRYLRKFEALAGSRSNSHGR